LDFIVYFIIDGTKLPPICIFKGKKLPREEKIPSGILVWYQKNGWMDSQLMIRYVEYLNNIRMENHTQGSSAMLVYDSFRGHLEKSVKKKFHDLGFDLAVIPGG